MIPLHPIPEADHRCPHDDTALEVLGWYIPGMRMLAEMRCATCERRFYGDLPAGHGLGFPVLLDRDSGKVHQRGEMVIFSDYLRDSYAARVDAPVPFEVEAFRPPRRPILLNCLDWVYGHALLKLLNAQFYLDRRDEFDLIVMVPRALRWMVPDGAAEVWTVGLPFSRGAEWNDWLGREIHQRVESLGECRLSFAVSHPDAADFDIERFTGVTPFGMTEWAGPPVITYVWREDRAWGPTAKRSVPARAWRAARRVAGLSPAPNLTQPQIVHFAEELRRLVPRVDFAVAGFGEGAPLPSWIGDMRSTRPDARTEREWCERYARSQVVVGVHGSHMLLPTAHAGGLIEMVTHSRWDSRWGNLIQDVLVRGKDVRDVLYRHHFLPANSTPDQVAAVAAAMVRYQPTAALHFGREYTDHETLAKTWRSLPDRYRAASSDGELSVAPRQSNL